MNAFRYWVALVLVMWMPGAVLFWFSIHPFVAFWRRAGTRVTLAIHYSAMVVVAVVMYYFRQPLLSVEYGMQPVLLVGGAILLGISTAFWVGIRRHLKYRILSGVPELATDGHGGALLAEGIYSRIRHPRYVQLMFGLAGWAMILNYLATYVLAAATIAALRVIVWMEEKELRARFGILYEEYAARVPRFIPSKGPSRKSGETSPFIR